MQNVIMMQRPAWLLTVKFDSCNNLLSSVQTDCISGVTRGVGAQRQGILTVPPKIFLVVHKTDDLILIVNHIACITIWRPLSAITYKITAYGAEISFNSGRDLNPIPPNCSLPNCSCIYDDIA